MTGFEDPELRRLFAEAMRQGSSPQGLFAYYNASEIIDVTPLLAEIEAPTLVMYDTAFPFGSFGLCRDVASRIKDSHFVVLDGRSIAGTDEAGYLRILCQFLGADREIRIGVRGAEVNSKPVDLSSGLVWSIVAHRPLAPVELRSWTPGSLKSLKHRFCTCSPDISAAPEDETMQELNAGVDVKGEIPKDVAHDWLRQNKFVVSRG